MRGRRHNFRRGTGAEWSHILAGDENHSRVYPAYEDEPGTHRCSVGLEAQPCNAERGNGSRLRSPSGILWKTPPPYHAFLSNLEDR